MPLFLALCLAVLQFGLIIKAQIVLTHSAREGAKVLAEFDILDLSQLEPQIKQAIVDAGGLNPAKIQVRLTENPAKSLIEVEVSYDAPLDLPLIRNFASSYRLTAAVNVIKILTFGVI